MQEHLPQFFQHFLRRTFRPTPGHPQEILISQCEMYKLICPANKRFPQNNGSFHSRSTSVCCYKIIMVVFTGLLLLTGVLWGCTNPFIRQGTRGLRKVKSDTIVGQACAEVTFLLGNWKYVLPWLVNQAGSLVYLLAVQRVPLSLAVPAANSLAFAFTAITGAAVGCEQPLDSGSILGIVLIGVGTALCCWDKAD